MDKSKLSDRQWVKVLARLKKIIGIRIGCEVACCQFIEAVLWIFRCGAQWRCLPNSFGHWNSVFKRFARWARLGVWEKILERCVGQADLESVCIDSTVIRAHAVTDALGLPVRLILTGGQAADITQAIPLMQGIATGALLADKGDDADTLLDWLKERSMAAVIPPKTNRKVQRDCNWYLYRERHAVKCMFGTLKYYRRIATRFEKKANHLKEMLAFAAALLWLR